MTRLAFGKSLGCRMRPRRRIDQLGGSREVMGPGLKQELWGTKEGPVAGVLNLAGLAHAPWTWDAGVSR